MCALQGRYCALFSQLGASRRSGFLDFPSAAPQRARPINAALCMSNLRYLQLDVFAERPGGGNPLGVVIGADAWDDAAMQRFAAWTNLVETTFVLAPTRSQADYRLRIFTPAKEIPFAGHPTVGSAHAVLETGFAQASFELRQECAVGVLAIRVEHDASSQRLFVRSPAAQILKVGSDAGLRDVLGNLTLGMLPPAFVAGGRRWWIAEIASESALRAWRPDHAAIARLAHATDSLGLCVFARSQTPKASSAPSSHSSQNPAVKSHSACYDVVVRAFPAGVGIMEDPASGAANGLLAAYIAHAEPYGPLAHGYRVNQGREIGRDATIDVRIEATVSGSASASDPAIWVGGRVWTIIDGELKHPIE